MNNLILPPAHLITPNKIVQLDGNRIGLVMTDKSKGEHITAIAAEHLELASQYRWFRVVHDRTTYAQARGRLADGTKKHIYLHRLIADAAPDQIVDHRNANGLENTPSNIRLCTRSENNRNRRSARGSTSQFKGVKKNGNRWNANIRIPSPDGSRGKQICVGRFPLTPEGEIEAARCYDRAAILYHGEFLRLNFPDSAL